MMELITTWKVKILIGQIKQIIMINLIVHRTKLKKVLQLNLLRTLRKRIKIFKVTISIRKGRPSTSQRPLLNKAIIAIFLKLQ